MKMALLYYRNPIFALPAGIALINDFGSQLLDESRKYLKT